MSESTSALDKKIGSLAAELDVLYNQPNIITWKDFQHFIPLFMRNDVEETESHAQLIGQLSRQYFKKFTYYKPVEVIASDTDPTVVLRIPQVFLKLSSKPATKNQTLANVAAKKNLNSDLQQKQVRGLKQLAHNVAQTQKDNGQIAEFIRIRKETQTMLTDIYNKKNRQNGTEVPVINAPQSYTSRAILDDDE